MISVAYANILISEHGFMDIVKMDTFESILTERMIKDNLTRDNMYEIDWTRILNSKIILSDEFIVYIAGMIDWSKITRILSEAIINRYTRYITHWDVQLYGPPRTIEFLIEHKKRFNWNKISKNMPGWMDELHTEILEDVLDWHAITQIASKTYQWNRLCMIADKLDWEWISENNIQSEEFALRFINRIIWDCYSLDTSNLSTEFLYEIYIARKSAYEFQSGLESLPENTKYSLLINESFADGFIYRNAIQLGGTISLAFLRRHFDEIDMSEIRMRKILSEDDITAIIELMQ